MAKYSGYMVLRNYDPEIITFKLYVKYVKSYSHDVIINIQH